MDEKLQRNVSNQMPPFALKNVSEEGNLYFCQYFTFFDFI